MNAQSRPAQQQNGSETTTRQVNPMLDGSAFDRVEAAVDRAGWYVEQRRDHHLRVRCEVHEDRKASLEIDYKDAETSDDGTGRVMVRCFAGCTTEEILVALGLTWVDLFDQDQRAKPVPAQTRLVEVYDYTDAAGTLLYQVGRYEPKEFRGYLPPKDERVPYRLPRVMAAIEAGQPVYVVEGEKDVHSLEALGLTATTNQGGADCWYPHYSKMLRGAHVVIIADRDEAGRRHAQKVEISLKGKAASCKVVEAKVGKDVTDHLRAGHSIEDLVPARLTRRHLKLSAASGIVLRRPKWLWDRRLAIGSMGLLAGPEGLGKSTVAYWLAARVTRGELPGEHLGQPRAVLVVATEDAWEYTIAPRLLVAGADLERVFRVEVVESDDTFGSVSLPDDLQDTEEAINETGAALLLLDPLMSRLKDGLDTHRDGDVRRALEPVAALAERTGVMVLGIIHLNKGSGANVLDRVMASKAFTAVARSVSVVLKDPDDEQGKRRLFGTPKNNLGPDDLPSLSFTVESAGYHTDEGPATTGSVVWHGEVATSVAEALARAGEDPEVRTQTASAVDFLQEYLAARGGAVDSREVKDAAIRNGCSDRTLHRARTRLKVVSTFVQGAVPPRTVWSLPPSVPTSWGEGTIDIVGIDPGQSVSGTDKSANSANRAASGEPGTDTSCRCGQSAEAHPDLAWGPCTKCQARTHRYGQGGSSLCSECREVAS